MGATEATRVRRTPRTATRPSRKHRRGFTLIELIVVVFTIGALATVAIPSFLKYVYRAKRSEALFGLKGIHTLETAFYGVNIEYSDSFTELGFQVAGGAQVDDATIQGKTYSYTLQTFPVDGKSDANFRATATANLDKSDPFLDVVVIENDLTVVE